jgi:flagellin
VRAQNAANDINDPNARAALQQEIRNFVDAIQKVGTDTEYNGLSFLTGPIRISLSTMKQGWSKRYTSPSTM